MERKKIFIIGEQRSGSNLLRLMLNKSPQIAAPHPPHILLKFTPLLAMYGDLEIDGNFKMLIDDVARFVEKNPVTWLKVELDRNILFAKCKRRTLFDLFGAIMDIYANQHRSESWICKSMQNVRWLNSLEKTFDSPKYIYLYRDPRDVTLSFMKAVVGHKHPYAIAKKWMELQELCISASKTIPSSRFYQLKYEQLIKNPEECLMDVCNFLEIDYCSDMLKYYDSEEAINTARVSMLWENVKSPLIKNNSKKYLKYMSDTDLKIVESLAYQVMDVLNYERKVKDEDLLFFDENTIEEYILEDKRLQIAAEARINESDLERRRMQLDVINNIEERLKLKNHA